MDKTIAVKIERLVKHKVYGKFIRRSTKLLAHDELNSCSVGDIVTLISSRPLSKNKSWKLHSVDKKESS